MGTTNPLEDCLSQHRSFGSNYQGGSHSRKISIGVLVDSVANSQAKNIQEAGLQSAEKVVSRNEDSLKNGKGHIPLPEKPVTVLPKDASPWVSTRSFTPKISSSVAVNDAEHTQSFHGKARPRSKLSKKASAAHSVKYFAGKIFDDVGEKNSNKPTNGVEAGNLNNSFLVENPGFSTESEVLRGKEHVEETNRKTEAGGSETLRMKLWEILGEVSSPKNQCVGSQPVELLPNQEKAEEHTHTKKRSPNSDTIESDSERACHTSRRPLTRSFSRKKATTSKVQNNIETTKPACQQKERQQMSIFSFGGDFPGRIHGTTTDGPFNRKKIERSSGAEKSQGHKYEKAEEKQQSENNSGSKSAVEKSIFQGNKHDKVKSSHDRISNVFAAPKCQTKKDSFQSSPTLIIEQSTDVEKPRDAEIPKVKDQQEDIAVSFLKRKRGSIHEKSIFQGNKRDNVKDSHDRTSDVFVEPNCETVKKDSFQFSPTLNIEQPRDVDIPKAKDQQQDITVSLSKRRKGSIHYTTSPSVEIKSPIEHSSPGFLLNSNQVKHQDLSPADNIINTKGIRSFKSIWSSKSAKCISSLEVQLSNDEGEPKDCFFMKSSFKMGENRANRLPVLPTNITDSESSENDSRSKGCTESDTLSPEGCVAEKFLQSPNKSPCKEKPVLMTGCSPISESYKGVEECDELQMFMQQNHDDELASAVALFTVALDRVKTKLKSTTNIKSTEILRAAAEEIFLQSKNVESQIKIDMDKLTSQGKSQRKRLETRFQEQQQQLLGIYKKFKEQVDQHLENFGNIMEGLEEHELKLKGTGEKQRETHKKLLWQLEQAIQAQLDDAESRITAIQKSADQKMNQLKFVVAEFLKCGAFG